MGKKKKKASPPKPSLRRISLAEHRDASPPSPIASSPMSSPRSRPASPLPLPMAPPAPPPSSSDLHHWPNLIPSSPSPARHSRTRTREGHSSPAHLPTSDALFSSMAATDVSLAASALVDASAADTPVNSTVAVAPVEATTAPVWVDATASPVPVDNSKAPTMSAKPIGLPTGKVTNNTNSNFQIAVSTGALPDSTKPITKPASTGPVSNTVSKPITPWNEIAKAKLSSIKKKRYPFLTRIRRDMRQNSKCSNRKEQKILGLFCDWSILL